LPQAAASNSQAPAVALPKDAVATLRSFHNQGDEWVVVRCGEWLEHPLGWQGPALALVQVRLCLYFLQHVRKRGEGGLHSHKSFPLLKTRSASAFGQADLIPGGHL
jgi:hypothetical protein